MNYCEDPNPSHYCYDCDEKEGILNEIKYWFNALLTLSYQKPLALEEEFEREFEIYLEELACCIGQKIPKRDIQLARKINPQLRADLMLEEWVSYNQQHLTNITNNHEELNVSIRTN